MDAVRRPNGAFPLSQQLRGAGELRAAFEANLSLAANKHTAARISLPDESDAPLFMARTRGAVQGRSVGAKTGSASRTIPAGFQCGPAKRWSLLDFYYTAIDYEDKLCMYCAENKVHLKVVSAETLQQPCRILHCRVRRWEVKRFLTVSVKPPHV